MKKPMTKAERLETLESALELLEEHFGTPCDRGCQCIFHPLRRLIREERAVAS